MDKTEKHSIILFDGVCNLCNSSINFVIRHDPKNRFQFAALQSEIGASLTEEFTIDPNDTDSIILIENNTAYVKSTAALRIAKGLSGAYPLLYAFIIIPTFIRNKVYDYVAKNRYKWYGKKDSCMIPTPELKSRFL
ncbi:thiol-disulfide oxidoreductase DCC family protein [Cochleicola gelatinilyticus]|uniref:Thiol-disulfide oxidoreductase n=1 Tax=Cochleicola gelatinilyticus TaxID=1763537 RepID=A0A167GVZ5_9FLAO|nr:thiol-disulfide oxidoreductase DCC family protein [Cochleicola gelatinilyticus]OAB77960.1 thiol-disulfide oxidoreductase [Cochleicola gelatinilyticus]